MKLNFIRMKMIGKIAAVLFVIASLSSCSKSNVEHPTFIAGVWEVSESQSATSSGNNFTYQLVVNNEQSQHGAGRYCRMTRISAQDQRATEIFGYLSYNPESGEGDITFKGNIPFVSYGSLYAEEDWVKLFPKKGDNITAKEVTFKRVAFPSSIPGYWKGNVKASDATDYEVYLTIFSKKVDSWGNLSLVSGAETLCATIGNYSYNAADGKASFDYSFEDAPTESYSATLQFVIKDDAVTISFTHNGKEYTGLLSSIDANPFDIGK